jgi:L-Ala-D/L-Glu epimerase
MNRQQFLKTLGLGAAAAVVPAGRGFASPRLAEARAAAKAMKIKDVEIYYADIKLAEPLTVAFGTIYNSNGVFIRVLTDAGLIGSGESCPLQFVTGDTQATNIDAARDLREALKGKDPLALENTGRIVDTALRGNPSIAAAFDMALYDILGQTAGLPIYRLLGGDKSTFEIDFTIGIDTPEKMAQVAKAHAAAGFRTHKVKIGKNPDQDIVRLKGIREAVGPDAAIRIDANQGYTVPQAIYTMRNLEKFHIEYCEQPVVDWDIDGLKQVRQGSPIPIMADESLHSPVDAIRLIKAEAVDYFNIKIMKSGGMRHALQISTIAEAADIRCMVGCMSETRLGLAASAHVVAAQKNIVFADLDSFLSLAVDPVIGGMTVKDGMVTMPETPGLGASFDPAFLKTLKKA